MSNRLPKEINLRYNKTDRRGCAIATIISTIVRVVIWSNYLESEMSGFSQMVTENSDRQNDRSGD